MIVTHRDRRMTAVDFDNPLRCHGSVSNETTPQPVDCRIVEQRVHNTDCSVEFWGLRALTLCVGNRFCSMAVRQRMKPQKAVSPAEQAAVGVLIAADHLHQSFAEICERHGITTDQYRVLRILRDAPPTGYARGEVTSRCSMHRSPDMTRMLDRLVRLGFAKRRLDPDDRRCSVSTVTRQGSRCWLASIRDRRRCAAAHEAAEQFAAPSARSPHRDARRPRRLRSPEQCVLCTRSRVVLRRSMVVSTVAPAERSASEQITDVVASWPGVTTGHGNRGERWFRMGRREIGHLHGDAAAHFASRVTCGLRCASRAASSATRCSSIWSGRRRGVLKHRATYRRSSICSGSTTSASRRPPADGPS